MQIQVHYLNKQKNKHLDITSLLTSIVIVQYDLDGFRRLNFSPCHSIFWFFIWIYIYNLILEFSHLSISFVSKK